MAIFDKGCQNSNELQFLIVGGMYPGTSKIIAGEEVILAEVITFDVTKKMGMAVLVNDVTEDAIKQMEIIYVTCPAADGKNKRYVLECDGTFKRVGNHTISFKGKAVEL